MTTLAAAPSSDPGDDVQRRFRYQHAYGVVLLLALAGRRRNGRALWCEHHEDFLVELENALYDAIQVKTREAGLGRWTLRDDGVVRALSRFCALEHAYQGQLSTFEFVSNHPLEDGDETADCGRSLLCLQRECKRASSRAALGPHAADSLDSFCQRHVLDCDVLFRVLTRLVVTLGPGLDSFETVVSHEHIAEHPACKTYTAQELNATRDELLHQVFRASSLANDDPGRHVSWIGLADQADPRKAHKRLVPETLIEEVLSSRRIVFRLTPAGLRLPAATPRPALSKFEQKAERGGLGFAIDTLRRRTISAERHLLALTAVGVDEAQGRIDEWAAAVKAECDDARLLASASGEPFGMEMLRVLQLRLGIMAQAQPAGLTREPGFLLGLAGLLTEDCVVWWSAEFQLEGTR